MNVSVRGVIWRVAGSALILAVLFAFLPLEELIAGIRRLPLSVWAWTFVAFIGVHLTGTIKWRLLVNLAGARLPFVDSAACHFAGLFGNLFLPSILGGDLVRGGLAYRKASSGAGIILGSLLDRAVDLVALLGLAALGAILVAHQEEALWFAAGGAALAGFLSVVLLLAVSRSKLKHNHRLLELHEAFKAVARKPRYVALALVLGFGVQLSLIALTAWIGVVCGLKVPMRVWLFVWPLAKLSALLPISQGGIGVREAALVALLAPFGAPPVLTLVVGLIWETIIVATGLIGGILSLVLRSKAPAWSTP
jgi:uncharacterized membrane protein YbhN (UPF0104 family)